MITAAQLCAAIDRRNLVKIPGLSLLAVQRPQPLSGRPLSRPHPLADADARAASSPRRTCWERDRVRGDPRIHCAIQLYVSAYARMRASMSGKIAALTYAYHGFPPSRERRRGLAAEPRSICEDPRSGAGAQTSVLITGARLKKPWTTKTKLSVATQRHARKAPRRER